MLTINADKQFSGRDIFHPGWPGADWNLSALFAHDELIIEFITMLQTCFDAPNPVHSVHGSIPIKWNSGRIAGSTLTATQVQEKIQPYFDWGTRVYFTFSNHLLEEDDLDDPTGNFMLKLIAAAGNENGVIVSSDLLSDYIHDTFPELIQIASVVKVTLEKGKGKLDYYKDLEERFDKYVVHPDDNFNYELLEKLDPAKAEFLLNEPCLINCANRIRHYELIAQTGLDIRNVFAQEELKEFTECTCESIPFTRQLEQQEIRRNLCLGLDEVQKLAELGFYKFKLQGRNYGHNMFLYDLTRYLLEPEYAAPLFYKAL